jgi:predicted nucleic acid-binding protein
MDSDEAVSVVYDANVLIPFHIAHLLLFVAQARLVRARWSADIQWEWVERSLEKFLGLSRESIERRRDAMNRAIPDAIVAGYEHRIGSIRFPDPDDRHVVAAALQCGAKIVVTLDKQHFNAKSLAPYGLTAVDPDALASDLHRRMPGLVVEAIDRARCALTRTKPEWAAYLRVLEDAGFAGLVRRLREDPDQGG